MLHTTAERKTSCGKDWHSACLRCERCSKTLTPGGHAVRDDKPYCHTPCYATLFGPSGNFILLLVDQVLKLYILLLLGFGAGGSSYKYDQK